jgi:predicted flavoprotein YhiN
MPDPVNRDRILIAGGGAAGFFAAIACAQARPGNDVRIYERASHFLTKVRISGGGRCNVTHRRWSRGRSAPATRAANER